jgi:hypothetical protein
MDGWSTSSALAQPFFPCSNLKKPKLMKDVRRVEKRIKIKIKRETFLIDHNPRVQARGLF